MKEKQKSPSLRQATQNHFARTRPIVGSTLRQVRVALMGLPQAAAIVTHLAACGVRRWWWVEPEDDSALTLPAYLRAQHEPALNLEVTWLSRPAWGTTVERESPDLVVAMGPPADIEQALTVAAAARVPALFITGSDALTPGQAICMFPGDDPAEVAAALNRVDHPVDRALPDPWDWLTAAPLCAGLARAMLLRHTPYARPDLAELWPAGIRVMTWGGDNDPFRPGWLTYGQAAANLGANNRHTTASFRTPMTKRGRILIAGLGSLGSVAARYLVPYNRGMVIADPNRVDDYNPVRQAYPVAAIGQPKAQSLRHSLLVAGATDVVALETALVDESAITALITRYNITAALVVTGTSADFALARALRNRAVPHLVGRCYPRARYWEAIVVDGRRGPALSDLRGRLSPGPAAPPTPEQIAAYSDAGALEAEPATLIESGWAAAWVARLTTQLLAPVGLRERWFLELLATGKTCLIGGVGVEATPTGPAYGITRPGAIRAWGQAEIRSKT